MKERKGISLIVLVITIIVIIILASAVILSLSTNNPIQQAEEAKFKTNLNEYNSELALLLANEYLNNNSFDVSTFDKTEEETNTYLSNLSDEDLGKFKIEDGKLVYTGSDTNKQTWAEEIGVESAQSNEVQVPEGEVATSLNDIDGDGYFDIWYLDQLVYIDTNEITLSNSYELMRDLDFNDDDSYLDVEANKTVWTTQGWTPLGTVIYNDVSREYEYNNCFNGDFNGNNYSIDNLILSNPDGDEYIGLFGGVLNSEISNFNLLNVSLIDPAWQAGGIIGESHNVTMTNCYVNGIFGNADSASESSWLGSLIGEAYDTVINNCGAEVNIFGQTDVGGLVGETHDVTINNSYMEGQITATGECVGGLVGLSRGVDITNSYVNVDIIKVDTGYLDLCYGGLVGDGGSSITDCYVKGSIICQGEVVYVGGLSGNAGSITVTNTYVDMDISGNTDYVGGLFGGLNGGTVTNSYINADINVNGENTSPTVAGISAINYETTIVDGVITFVPITIENNTFNNVFEKTEEELKYQATYVGFDFDTIWSINEGISTATLR